MKNRLFVETVQAHFIAGNGGNGCRSFRREAGVPRGGPDGGNGGRGGDVILRADRNVSSLVALFYQPIQRADHGRPGRGKQMAGANGKNIVINVPCGTVMLDTASGEQISELLQDGEEFVIVRGGRGGLGNLCFKSATRQAPTEYTEGEPGEEKKVKLVLKTIADVGLIGLPNAGKSTLLSAISQARPKTASYPFTTLHPILGTVQYAIGENFTVVDIPGLIEGAHRGAGLGLEFLRHVERARLLAVVLDMAGTEGRQPVDDYCSLLNELKHRDPALLERPRLVIANKMDMPEAAANLKEFIKITKNQPHPISAREGSGLQELIAGMHAALVKINP